MDSSIRRIEPDAAIPGHAVRRVGPRRHREDAEHAFEDELAEKDEKRASPAPSNDERRSASPVAPAADDEAGARIDLLG